MAWWWVRQVFGDAAYENYLRSRQRQTRRQHPDWSDCGADAHGRDRSGGEVQERDRCGSGEQNSVRGGSATRLLSREEFYLDSLRRRYSGVSRCC